MPEDRLTSVDRAFEIIAAFGPGDDKLSLQEINQRTSLNKATIIRLVGSLERHGYVLKLGQGDYALGPAFIKYSTIYRASFDLGDHALPILRNLVELTGESAALFVRNKDMRVCVHKVEPTDAALVSSLREGDSRPILPGGTGKILLAFSDQTEEAMAWQTERENYLATSDGERHESIAGIAAPVFRAGEELVGAMSLSGPRTDFTKAAENYFKLHLLRAAADLSGRLGGNAKPLATRIERLEAKKLRH